TESVCRICRREGAKLYLKGSRCYTKKCAFERRPSPPGQHGVRRRKVGEYGLRTLELRLDNVAYRMGFAPSRAAARQLVTHGHFAVNGVPTNIPSYQVKPGDKVEVRETRRSREPFKVAKETLRNHQAPEWLVIDATNLSGNVVTPPSRDQMP